MKNIIIYTTADKIISLKLVDHIVSDKNFKDWKIDIIVKKSTFVRKLKILFVIFFFGSLKNFLKNLMGEKVSIKQILKKNPNCKLVKDINKEYDFGLSVYSSYKIKLEKFKIYNFHLGNLFNQRGSFIFFYKFLKNWSDISLTFHEITEKFDVGDIINERKIELSDKTTATDLIFMYLENLDFLITSVKNIDLKNISRLKEYQKLNVVPSFFRLLKELFIYFFNK